LRTKTEATIIGKTASNNPVSVFTHPDDVASNKWYSTSVKYKGGGGKSEKQNG